jgi:hypothetical protein
VPALPQQERRAALVRVFRHHLEEERLTTFSKEPPMQFDNFSFGSIQIDGSTSEHDVVIDRGEISKGKKKASKQFREEFGHTPLSVEENIPWKCRQLVIGSGAYGRLPVMQEVRREAERLKIKLLVLANRRGHQGFGTRREGYQCHPPRDLLVVCRCRESLHHSWALDPEKERA